MTAALLLEKFLGSAPSGAQDDTLLAEGTLKRADAQRPSRTWHGAQNFVTGFRSHKGAQKQVSPATNLRPLDLLTASKEV